MDVATWGHDTWDTLLFVAWCGDRGSRSERIAALKFLVLMTATLPCAKCREFYSHSLHGLLKSPAMANVPLIDWLVDLRAIVTAKISPTTVFIPPTHNRHQLYRRLDATGLVPISSDAILVALAFQARNIEALPRDATPGAAFRDRMLRQALDALVRLTAHVRPRLSLELGHALRAHASNTLAAIHATYVELTDTPRDAIPTLREFRARLARGLKPMSWFIATTHGIDSSTRRPSHRT